MDDENILELLEIYQDMIEKQDEIIHRLGKIVSKLATDIQLLKNDNAYSEKELQHDMEQEKGAEEQLNKLRSGIEP